MTIAMKKTPTIKAVAVLMAFGLLSSPSAFSSESGERQQSYEQHHQKSHNGHRMKQGHHGAKLLKKMARHLDLSDEQIAQIKEIRRQSKIDNEPLRTEIKAFKAQVKSQQVMSDFDEVAFIASYEQYQTVFAQLALNKAKTRHAIFHVLTQDQQAKWQAFKEKRKARRSAE